MALRTRRQSSQNVEVEATNEATANEDGLPNTKAAHNLMKGSVMLKFIKKNLN